MTGGAFRHSGEPSPVGLSRRRRRRSTTGQAQQERRAWGSEWGTISRLLAAARKDAKA